MKKLFILQIISLLLIFSIFLIAEDKQQTSSSGATQEVVVKGQLKIKIEAEKPELVIKTNSNDVAEAVIKTEEEILGLSPYDIKDIRLGLPAIINETRPEYHAYLNNIETQPIFKIVPKVPAGIEIEKWTFKVTDPTGASVMTLKGSGNLPSKFEWDGFDNNGNMMKLNAPYLYLLSYMDKAGNPGSVRKKEPKIVQVIKYFKDGKFYIEASNFILFEKQRKDRLTDKGKEIITEIEDYIKMSNRFPVEIKVYSEDIDLAKEQADSLLRIFENSLKIPKDNFDIKTYKDTDAPRNYRIVFIINS
ncbi:MAG: hypothetical protein N2114_01450 [Candidatus Goldbacteria bacterium]|nr:hypothetical protein [Candidatus Goldiibacteriota bacterium]